MIQETRLYLWMKTVDKYGNFVRNAQDVVKVVIHTQEVVWSLPSDVDWVTSEHPDLLKEHEVATPIPDPEMEGVSYQIFKSTDTFRVTDFLASLRWRYHSDKKVDLEVKYNAPASYPHYNIDSDTMGFMMKSFDAVSLHLGYQTVQLPKETFPNDMGALAIYDAVVDCQDMVGTFDSVTMGNCVLKSAATVSFFSFTVKKGFTVDRVILQTPIFFQVLAKNDNLGEWVAMEANIKFVDVRFNAPTDARSANLFKLSNFNTATVFQITAVSEFPNLIYVMFDSCITTSVSDFSRVCSKDRETFDIVFRACEDISVANSNFVATKATSKPRAAIMFETLSQGKVQIRNSTFQNACILRGVSSTIAKLTVDSINNAEVPDSFYFFNVTARDVLFRNVSLKNVESLNSLSTEKLAFKNAQVSGESLTLTRVKDFSMTESKLSVVGKLAIDILTDGRFVTTGSAIVAKEIFVEYKYTDEENSVLSAGSDQERIKSILDANKSLFRLEGLSSIKGSLTTKNLGRFVLLRAKVECDSFNIHALQTGESHFDIHSVSANQQYTIDVKTLRNFNATVFKSTKSFRMKFKNADGFGSIAFRDPDLTTDTHLQPVVISIEDSKCSIEFKNEALVRAFSLSLNSKNSSGSKLLLDPSEKTKNSISLKLDPTCPDFFIMRRYAGEDDPSHVLYG